MKGLKGRLSTQNSTPPVKLRDAVGYAVGIFAPLGLMIVWKMVERVYRTHLAA